MSKIISYQKDYDIEPFKIQLGTYFGVVIAKPEDVQVGD